MNGKLVDFIPYSMKIEIEDIGHLFWRYCCQSQTATPHQAAKEWIGQMNDVCNEEWGEDLKIPTDVSMCRACLAGEYKGGCPTPLEPCPMHPEVV